MIKRNMIREKTWENENPFSDLESQREGEQRRWRRGYYRRNSWKKKSPKLRTKVFSRKRCSDCREDEWKILVNFRAPMIADIYKHFQKGKHKRDLEKSVSRMTQLPTSLEDLSSNVTQRGRGSGRDVSPIIVRCNRQKNHEAR